MTVEHIASRYRIIRELGRGGMGVVYLVEHLHTGEYLALKLLHGSAASDPDVLARFKREARVGAQIKSDYVVRVTDADVAPELEGAPFFVMELLEGLDLEKLVARAGPLHRDLVISLFSQIGRALDKAHNLGIVHRDLKPENIFLHRREDETLIAKVLDFGISKFLQPNGSEPAGLGATREGTLMGTPYYMAPEQARGDVEMIGPATDVWALGLVALRLLTAESYWSARTQADLLVQLLVAPMSRPTERWPHLGERFDAWFARSCNRDPFGRWNQVSEQVSELADVLRSTQDFGGATMTSVYALLAQQANRETNAPVLAIANVLPPGSSVPRERTITAAVPASAHLDGVPRKGTGDTTVRANLSRTARQPGSNQRRALVAGTSVVTTLVLVWAAYRAFDAGRGTVDDQPARASLAASTTYSSASTADPPASPSTAGEGSNSQIEPPAGTPSAKSTAPEQGRRVTTRAPAKLGAVKATIPPTGASAHPNRRDDPMAP